uniref:olfactory receptor 8U3-like n=1 Tax=Panthera onca TaxID=9690 RepID=UPI002955CF43|nr:olfactory receptor 8U3-like [Panthera onca]
MAWMNQPNQTVLTEFILMGITDRPGLQAPFFGLFLIIYVISVVGNLGMIILTKVDSRLQTPMYFFLRHLAFIDLGYSTAVGPKMLVNFIANQNTILSAFNLVSSLLIVLVSYILILMAILRMNSAQGRHKAFSTCGSHLTVVVVLYATLFFMYVQPKSSHSFDTDKIASAFYTLIIPMLNPMIYSLRNKEVKSALCRIWKNLHKLPV